MDANLFSRGRRMVALALSRNATKNSEPLLDSAADEIVNHVFLNNTCDLEVDEVLNCLEESLSQDDQERTTETPDKETCNTFGATGSTDDRAENVTLISQADIPAETGGCPESRPAPSAATALYSSESDPESPHTSHRCPESRPEPSTAVPTTAPCSSESDPESPHTSHRCPESRPEPSTAVPTTAPCSSESDPESPHTSHRCPESRPEPSTAVPTTAPCSSESDPESLHTSHRCPESRPEPSKAVPTTAPCSSESDPDSLHTSHRCPESRPEPSTAVPTTAPCSSESDPESPHTSHRCPENGPELSIIAAAPYSSESDPESPHTSQGCPESGPELSTAAPYSPESELTPPIISSTPESSIDPEVVSSPAIKPKGPEKWKANVRKRLRQSGQEYECAGVVRPGRKLFDRCNCKSKGTFCTEIDDDDRNETFNYVWSLSWEAKRTFVMGFVDKIDKKKTYAKTDDTKRQHTYVYHLKIKGMRKTVCKTMFLNTTAMTQWFVHSSLDNATQNDSRTQNHPHWERASEDKIFLKENFFKNLPKMPSHYCRQSSKKLYLEPLFKSIADLHRAYIEKCTEFNRKHLSLRVFHEVFKEENLSLFTPKKDQCDICVGHETGNVDDDVWNRHQEKKEAARKEKDEDKQSALASKDILVLCMDLQCVLLSPRLQASALYYKTKLAVHNFTIYDTATRDVMCYVWHEGEGKLSANEFASCIVHYLTSKVSGHKKVIIFSDGCTYQNRNCVLSNALSYVATCLNITIEQKILTKGHTQMEVDSVHSVIERALKNTLIYVPMDYINLIKMARKNPKPYDVMYLEHTFFQDFSAVTAYKSIRPGRQRGDPTVVDIQALQYTPKGNINFKLHFSDAWQDIPKPRNHKDETRPPTPLYHEKIKIQDSKFKHLQELKAVIPKDHHAFYDNLPH